MRKTVAAPEPVGPRGLVQQCRRHLWPGVVGPLQQNLRCG